jgi:hypothetical protein
MLESTKTQISQDEKAQRFDVMGSLIKAGMKPLDLLMSLMLILDPEAIRSAVLRLIMEGKATELIDADPEMEAIILKLQACQVGNNS